MNDKPTIYCQMGFLEKFIKLLQNSFDSLLIEDENNGNILTATYKLVFGKAVIHLNISPEELIKNQHPLIKKFIKNPTALIKCNPELSQKFEDESFWKEMEDEVFLLDENNVKAHDIENNWGLMVLTPENLKEKGIKLTARAPMFLKQHDKKFSFNRLIIAKHTFHRAILVDNYLTANEQDIQNNIVPLLKAISNGSPAKRPIKLTVVTTNDNILALHKSLIKCLANDFPSIEITVAKTQTLKNHDRHLITNQLWMSSGFGFNLLAFDRNKKCLTVVRDTTIFILPRISNERATYYSDLDSEVSWSYFSSASNLLARFNVIIENSRQDRGTQQWLISNA